MAIVKRTEFLCDLCGSIDGVPLFEIQRMTDGYEPEELGEPIHICNICQETKPLMAIMDMISMPGSKLFRLVRREIK